MTPKIVQNKIFQGELDPDCEDDKREILNSLDWKKLDEKCARYFKRAPTVDFMYVKMLLYLYFNK